MEILTIKHPKFFEFCSRLSEQQIPDEMAGKTVEERPLARMILENYYPEIDVEATFDYFDEFGGYNDVEILLNVLTYALEMPRVLAIEKTLSHDFRIKL